MSTPSRRKFLSTSAAFAGLAITAPHVACAAKREVKDIRLAVIGVKGRGSFHMKAFADNVVAVCDVDNEILQARAGKYEKDFGRKLETFQDYRKLLERDDIDTVSIATPNHTHSLIAIAAMKAGKDVYVEKPVSNNVWEGRQLALAAKKYGRVIQCGTQSRSSKCLKEATAWVQAGGLGKIVYSMGTCYKARMPIGQLDAPLQIPSSIDYDMWCGPADKVDIYRPKLHYDWHWDYNTGAGDMGNQGIHQMDIARWFLGEKGMAPRAISIGARLGYEDAANSANTQIVLHDYDAAPLLFETRGLPRSIKERPRWSLRSMDSYRGSRVGVVVQCEEGHILVAGAYRNVYVFDKKGKRIKHFKGGGRAFGSFLDAVAAQDPSMVNAPIQEGHISSALCHAGNVSHRVGEHTTTSEIAKKISNNELLSKSFARMAKHLKANKVDIDSGKHLVLGQWLDIDPKNDTLIGNDAGQKFWKREGREGFKVPNMEQG